MHYPRWWEPIVNMEDFASLQSVKWITLGGVGELPTVAEGATYTELTWDDQMEIASFIKKGGYLGITLEAIDKDDTRRLQAAPRALAQAAWLTLAKSVSEIFTTASGTGPTMSDSVVLFHSNHANLGSTALSITTWAAARLAMRKQTELNSSERLGALTAPKFLLVPPDLEVTALQVLASDHADVVIQKGKMRVFSPHREYNPQGKSAYFKIPSWFFLFSLGMTVHRIPLRILAIDVPNFLSFDKDRARILCHIIAYVAVKDPVKAAKRFGGDLNELQTQINKIVQATTRDVCTKSTVREIINDRAMVIRMVDQPLKETIGHWGIDLKDLELVDFKDPTEAEYGETAPPHVIRDISSIIDGHTTATQPRSGAYMPDTCRSGRPLPISASTASLRRSFRQ